MANRDQTSSGRIPPLLHHWRTPLLGTPKEVQHRHGALLPTLPKTHFSAENHHQKRACWKPKGSVEERLTRRKQALPTSPELHQQQRTWWSSPQPRSPVLPSTRSNRQPSSAPESGRPRSTAELRSNGLPTGGLTPPQQFARDLQCNTPWHLLPRHQHQELQGDRLLRDQHHLSTTPQ